MDSISALILGFIIAIAYVFDITYSKKGSWFFGRSLIYVLSVSLPLLFNENIPNHAFYGFAIGLVIGGFYIFFGIYKKSIKKIEEFDDKDEDLEFFNLLMNGYSDFKNKVKEKRKVLEKQQEKYNKTYLKVHDELKKSLPKFILDIYSSMHSKDNDFRTYSTYVMTKFINDFFSNSNARFTLRILDQNKNTMTSKITTREIAPSDIPLNKDNMISKSLKFKKPLIYSENKKYHYDTNISIEQKIFDDYVTYCIVAKDNNIPIISVNLDVKGEESVNRMKAFVKTNIFTIVCDAITLYYKIESSKKDEQNV